MIQLAYILAASHSGSTLLAMLLGTHPEVCTVGELKLSSEALGDADRYRCSCHALIKACPFWGRVGDCMVQRGFSFDIENVGTDVKTVESRYVRRLLKPLHRGPLLEAARDAALRLSRTWRRSLAEIQRKNVAVMESISEITGGRVVVDSSKTALRLKYLLNIPGLNVKVIRLIRDGRGVALTYMRPGQFADAKDVSLRSGGSGSKGRLVESLTVAESAYQWRRSNEAAEHLLNRLERSQWIEVRYEDLCKDTGATLKRLLVFLGLNPSQSGRGLRSGEHHVVGNGMRLDSTSEIRLDERWKSVLSPEQLEIFDGIAGDVNRRRGYE